METESREDEDVVTVTVDMPNLLVRIIDDAVEAFAQAMTPKGGDESETRASLYRAIGDTCDRKAELTDLIGRALNDRRPMGFETLPTESGAVVAYNTGKPGAKETMSMIAGWIDEFEAEDKKRRRRGNGELEE